MDEASKYLKKVHQANRRHFAKGFVTATDGAPVATTSSLMVVDLVSGSRAMALPMKRKRTRRDDSDDEGNDEDSDAKTMQHSITAAVAQQPPCVSHSPVLEVAVTAPQRISLLDKWFPGTTLKEATLEAAQAPSEQFIQACVSRITKARERVIFVRSGVEDVEALLCELGATTTAAKDAGSSSTSASPGVSENQIHALVTSHTWAAVSEAFAQFADTEATSLAATRAMVGELLRKKTQVVSPNYTSVRFWHTFMDSSGPETITKPSLSQFVWLTCANTTALFTVVVQRFLRRVRGGRKGQQASLLHIVGEDGCESGNEKDAEGERDAESIAELLPPLSAELPAAHQQLLTFLRYLMPVSHEGVVSSGYGVWLMACLSALDTPLDPDTDTLVHDLFRTCCNQVRVLGEWKGIHGDQRGLLAESLPRTSGDSVAAEKLYSSLEDVDREDVLALHTIIVVLAKLFRQNQNGLIPL